jgi:hypothetical protein
VSTDGDVERFPFRPSRIVPSVQTLANELETRLQGRP